MDAVELVQDDTSVITEVRTSFSKPLALAAAFRSIVRHFPPAPLRRVVRQMRRGSLEPTAAALESVVCSAAYIHFSADPVVAGVRLPAVWVYVDSVRLDLGYTPGPEWSPTRVAGLVRLARELRQFGAVVEEPWAQLIGTAPNNSSKPTPLRGAA